MKRIEIDTELLQNNINSIEENINAAKNQIDTAYDGIRVLDTMWDGSANSAFNAQFASDYNRMIEICNAVADYYGKLREAKNQYIDGENRVSDIVSALRF